MAQITKLFLNNLEFSCLANYSIRIDQTVVVEPVKPLPETTYQKMLQSVYFTRVALKTMEDTMIECSGSYILKKVYGVLVFTKN
ncbi:hypothetical protein EQV77_16600 [Halobacillus fulvus]|nr:hypothetical protein EQV77_16600 [Halobacillus fulvus]